MRNYGSEAVTAYDTPVGPVVLQPGQVLTIEGDTVRIRRVPPRNLTIRLPARYTVSALPMKDRGNLIEQANVLTELARRADMERDELLHQRSERSNQIAAEIGKNLRRQNEYLVRAVLVGRISVNLARDLDIEDALKEAGWNYHVWWDEYLPPCRWRLSSGWHHLADECDPVTVGWEPPAAPHDDVWSNATRQSHQQVGLRGP